MIAEKKSKKVKSTINKILTKREFRLSVRQPDNSWFSYRNFKTVKINYTFFVKKINYISSN